MQFNNFQFIALRATTPFKSINCNILEEEIEGSVKNEEDAKLVFLDTNEISNNDFENLPVDEIDLYENKNNIVEAKIEIDEFTDDNEFGSKAVRRKTRNSHF